MSGGTRIVYSVSAVTLFFLALIWISFFRQNAIDKQDTIQFAIARNSNLAVALEQYAIRTLRNADAILQIVKNECRHEGDHFDLGKLLEANTLNRAFIDRVTIIDRDGQLKESSTTFPSNYVASYLTTSCFDFHRSNRDSLLMSKPMAAVTLGRPVIVVSRRLEDADGRFAGVVAIEMEPAAFTSFYAQAALLPNDIISLISPDGITYARRTGAKESWGEDIHSSPLFAHVVKHADSFYFAPDAIRHIPTWFSYRRLKEYPIIATVGSSEHDILKEFASKQLRFVTPRIIVSLLIIPLSIFICLFLLRRRRLAMHLLKKEERYQRLLTEQMIAVQEREREWIGRELHDNVSQVLTTVKLYLETAEKKGEHSLIPRSMQLINSSITEIRNLSHQLSAPTLGTRSLIDSINALLEMLAFSKRLEFEFDHAGYLQKITMSQKLAIYRILQEQLNNVMKHAEASKVWITLVQNETSTVLIVRDNGKGFDKSVNTNGMGLNNMISRAKIFGGTVDIESSLGRGCTLHVDFPLVTEDVEVQVEAESTL